jgi:hypothetical protein
MRSHFVMAFLLIRMLRNPISINKCYVSINAHLLFSLSKINRMKPFLFLLFY